jgi:tetratricopeptide (TPR) repeat protein
MMRFFAALAASLLLAAPLAAAADALYLSTPYDEITLDENNGNVLLKVRPLNLPNRQVPQGAARAGDLEVELLDRPGEKYKVDWATITNVTLFEQLVLAEANAHIAAGRFDDAYPSLRYLETKHPQTAGLKEAIENFLWVQIGGAFKAGRHEEALGLLVELHARNPQRPGINVAYERVTAELVKRHMADENYRAARGLLRNLVALYPATQATTAAPYESQLQARAAALLAEAQANLAAGKRREAHQTCSRMLDVWPAIAGGQELALRVHQEHPLVVVGVSTPLTSLPLVPSDDWAVQRAGRLLGRPLIERVAAGGDSGPFRSAIVEFSRGEEPSQLTLKLLPNIRGLDPGRDLAPHDIARCLMAQANPALAAYDPAFADVLAGASVQGADSLTVSFRLPQLRPEAWLEMPVFAGDADSAVRLGPYVLGGQSLEQVNFVRQPAYSLAGPTQPAEIVERTYRDGPASISALKRGEISVIARLNPWDLPKVAGSEIKVEAYALPRVHLLVPHPRHPLTGNRTFRRALVYAIDRAGTLDRGLLDGQQIAGCAALTGPFPRGPAYDESVLDRPYDPGLAMALVRLAVDEINAARQARGEQPLATPPKLVLAHSAEPTARVACQSIARQLRNLGLAVTSRELAPGQSPDDEVDLLYAEATMREPLVDAWRLLGPQGLTGDCTPTMLAELRALQTAGDDPAAVERLQSIHRLAAAELPVIPLWQLVDYLAYHTSVKGIGQRPVGLYDNIEQWQADFRIPAE